jgi:NAD(P)-dependent dehydrogenase (short-subunit alcohol dehydrogenase family)
LAEAGCNLIIHYNESADEAITVRDEIQDLGRKADIVQADFADPARAISIIQKYFQTNSVFAVINNASIFSDLQWDNTSIQEWDAHLAINLTMPFLLSQSFAKSYTGEESGRIINILDWRALRPGSDHFPYTISKSALAGLTKSLAASLAPRISVNGIALGAILPPSDGGETEEILSSVPHQRWGDLHEVVSTILFLLTGSDYITGEVIHLDGGRHLI